MSMDKGDSGFYEPPTPGGGGPGAGGPADAGGQGHPGGGEVVRHQPVSARVPERIGRGVVSTGALVVDSPSEFVIDFMQGLARPFSVAARIVLAPLVMQQFVAALRDNLNKYEQRFGPCSPLPRPPANNRPSLQEIYSEFKIPDEILSGSYANAVLVGHSPAEFFMDFITNFYPTSAVSCRVFMSAPQIPRLLETVTLALQRYQQRIAQQPPPEPPVF